MNMDQPLHLPLSNSTKRQMGHSPLSPLTSAKPNLYTKHQFIIFLHFHNEQEQKSISQKLKNFIPSSLRHQLKHKFWFKNKQTTMTPITWPNFQSWSILIQNNVNLITNTTSLIINWVLIGAKQSLQLFKKKNQNLKSFSKKKKNWIIFWIYFKTKTMFAYLLANLDPLELWKRVHWKCSLVIQLSFYIWLKSYFKKKNI